MKRGIIAPNFVLSLSHKDAEIDQTIEVFEAAFAVYRKALDEGIEKYLLGRSIQPVYRKWNGNV